MRVSVAGMFVGLLVVFGVSAGAGGEETGHVALPGAVWAIVPPPGFSIVAEPAAAFRHPSGVIILTQDGPKRPVTKADFVPVGAQPASSRLDELAEVTVDGKHGFFAIIYQEARQMTSMVLTVEGEQSNGNIIAAMPDSAGTAVPINAVREAVLSAVERPKTIDERLADMPFELGETSGMRVAYYLPGGASSC